MGKIPKVHMPTKAVRDWRQQILHRKKLVYQVVEVKNKIRALVKSQGLRPAARGSWWAKTHRRWFYELSETAGLWAAGLLDLLEQLALYEDQLKRTTQRLDAVLAQHSGGELLMSMPGVGPRTAEAVLAYTDEVERFRRGKEFGSYFGLTPKLDQSGQVCRNGHISKQGPSVVRWLISESAWRAVSRCAALRGFFDRVCRGQAKRRKTAIIATARKMLTVMRAMLISGKPYDASLVLRQVPSRERQRDFYHCA